jgi:RHS repeat-associated protein
LGQRVQWAYSGGADQHLFDPAGTWLGIAGQYSLVWRGDTDLAVYTGSETYFNHINNLVSAAMRTSHSGAPLQDVLFYPWGQVWLLWVSGGCNFAGMPYYETITNTSPTAYRFYSMNIGRWHSPDPLGGDIANPQSLNRYAYVMNNPASNIDPTGQACYGLMRALGACDAFMDNALGFGWNWNEFDLMNIPVVTTSYIWVPPSEVDLTIDGAVYPGQMSPGYWTTGTQGGAGIDLTAFIGVSGSLLSSVGSALDSAYGNALGALGKVFPGGRLPGQSYVGCVDQNINLTTFGLVSNSTKTLAAGLTGLLLTAVPSPAAGFSLGEYGLFAATGILGPLVVPGFDLPAALLATSTGAYGLAGATGGAIGLFLGSAANCAAERVGP